MKVVVLRVSQGRVVDRKVEDGDIYDRVKHYAAELIKSWDPKVEDFIVVRDYVSVYFPVPITRELLDKIRNFQPRRVEDRVEVTIPVYQIVYRSEWVGDNLSIGESVVLYPSISEDKDREIEEMVLRDVVGPGEEVVEEG